MADIVLMDKNTGWTDTTNGDPVSLFPPRGPALLSVKVTMGSATQINLTMQRLSPFSGEFKELGLSGGGVWNVTNGNITANVDRAIAIQANNFVDRLPAGQYRLVADFNGGDVSTTAPTIQVAISE